MNRKRGYLYILLAAMIYSTTEVALKGLGGVFAPMQITVERVLIGALYRSLGLDIFADVPFFTGFTLRSALLLCYVGIFCAAIGFLLTAKITEYTSATEASFVYLIKPVLATLLAVVCFRETISVNRMIGLVFFLAASLCVSLPVLREMRRDAVTAQPPR